MMTDTNGKHNPNMPKSGIRTSELPAHDNVLEMTFEEFVRRELLTNLGSEDLPDYEIEDLVGMILAGEDSDIHKQYMFKFNQQKEEARKELLHKQEAEREAKKARQLALLEKLAAKVEQENAPAMAEIAARETKLAAEQRAAEEAAKAQRYKAEQQQLAAEENKKRSWDVTLRNILEERNGQWTKKGEKNPLGLQSRAVLIELALTYFLDKGSARMALAYACVALRGYMYLSHTGLRVFRAALEEQSTDVQARFALRIAQRDSRAKELYSIARFNVSASEDDAEQAIRAIEAEGRDPLSRRVSFGEIEALLDTQTIGKEKNISLRTLYVGGFEELLPKPVLPTLRPDRSITVRPEHETPWGTVGSGRRHVKKAPVKRGEELSSAREALVTDILNLLPQELRESSTTFVRAIASRVVTKTNHGIDPRKVALDLAYELRKNQKDLAEQMAQALGTTIDTIREERVAANANMLAEDARRRQDGKFGASKKDPEPKKAEESGKKGKKKGRGKNKGHGAQAN